MHKMLQKTQDLCTTVKDVYLVHVYIRKATLLWNNNVYGNILTCKNYNLNKFK